jgi:hypothetical protein
MCTEFMCFRNQGMFFSIHVIKTKRSAQFESSICLSLCHQLLGLPPCDTVHGHGSYPVRNVLHGSCPSPVGATVIQAARHSGYGGYPSPMGTIVIMRDTVGTAATLALWAQ